MDKIKLIGNFTQKGCLHQRGKDPVWYATVSDDVIDEDRSIKRIRRKFRIGLVSELSEEEARLNMAQIIARLTTKTAPTNLITVRQLINEYFRPQVVATMKHSGQTHYAWLFDRHIIPAIGDRQMRDLNLSPLQKLCNMKLETGLSIQSVTHIKAGLSAIFRHALALRIIEGSNPASAIRLPEMTRKDRHTPTPEEARALVNVLQDPFFSPIREMVILSCATSVHFAEMMALRWKRVNLGDQPIIADGRNLPAFSLAIRENYYRGSFGSTKTRARNRIEPLPTVVVKALAALQVRSKFTGPEDLVFCDGTGEVIDEDVLRRKLKQAGEKAGTMGQLALLSALFRH